MGTRRDKYEVVSPTEIFLDIHGVGFYLTEKEVREFIKLLTDSLFGMKNFKQKEGCTK